MELPGDKMFHCLLNERVDMLGLCKFQVKIWDPSLRGSELRATLKGHTRFSLTVKFPVWFVNFF